MTLVLCVYMGIQETTKESLEGVAYTIKEINAMSNCHVFTVAAFCSLQKLPQVQEVWTTVFTNVDTLYCVCKRDQSRFEGVKICVTNMYNITCTGNTF